MGTTILEPSVSKSASTGDTTRKQIRGSSLLVAGRLLSIGINFGSQVLIVRHLSTTEFGTWAYALSVVAFCQGIVTFGLDRAITRFIPIYHEKEEHGKIFGTILLVVGSILFTGAVAIGVFYALPEATLRMVIRDPQSSLLLYTMIFLVPVEAIDGLLIGMFASFASSRAIFFRKHLLGPSLKLTVVLLLIMRQSEVIFLAYGYLAASAGGVLMYVWVLMRILRRQGLLQHLHSAKIIVPAKEIFSFTVPLLTSDLVTILMQSVGVLLLGYFHDSSEVAYFRVVLPAAHMNMVIMTSFGLLYTPLAARLFARGDYSGINELYWQTAAWMAVLTFPIFVVTFALAEPLTVLLYGARYERSGVIMAMLALGYYFSVALGCNGLTLKVLGKLRYVVATNLLAAVTNVVANLLLIPRYGAIGAAIGSAGTLIVHNLLKQGGLRLASGISLYDRRYSLIYLIIAASVVGLFVVQLWLPTNVYVAFGLAGLVSLFVLAVSRKSLEVEKNFPELLKIPFMKKILV